MIMILTDKCYDDFNNWVHKTHDYNFDGSYGKRLFYISSLDDYKFIETDHYIYNIGDSMLNALIIEFFDSVGIYISLNYVNFYDEFRNDKGFEAYVTNNGLSVKFRSVKTRQEATKQAIKKANDIYNEKES